MLSSNIQKNSIYFTFVSSNLILYIFQTNVMRHEKVNHFCIRKQPLIKPFSKSILDIIPKPGMPKAPSSPRQTAWYVLTMASSIKKGPSSKLYWLFIIYNIFYFMPYVCLFFFSLLVFIATNELSIYHTPRPMIHLCAWLAKRYIDILPLTGGGGQGFMTLSWTWDIFCVAFLSRYLVKHCGWQEKLLFKIFYRWESSEKIN